MSVFAGCHDWTLFSYRIWVRQYRFAATLGDSSACKTGLVGLFIPLSIFKCSKHAAKLHGFILCYFRWFYALGKTLHSGLGRQFRLWPCFDVGLPPTHRRTVLPFYNGFPTRRCNYYHSLVSFEKYCEAPFNSDRSVHHNSEYHSSMWLTYWVKYA